MTYWNDAPAQPGLGSHCVEMINRLTTSTVHQKSEETGCYIREAAERVPKGIMIRPFVKLTKADIED
ncbi:MAG: hypothetical protein IPJ48_06230 [Propionivibrio sp.]|uniref:Uncharacterized protein n=1 Tax=Candidatus Propionivibrio dominans TaxID=2954373 RepID=A0A9D7F5Y8_9RHOO|nr:hypothetical protein [Candidatus Propionivibrio dominans]